MKVLIAEEKLQRQEFPKTKQVWFPKTISVEWSFMLFSFPQDKHTLLYVHVFWISCIYFYVFFSSPSDIHIYTDPSGNAMVFIQ